MLVVHVQVPTCYKKLLVLCDRGVQFSARRFADNQQSVVSFTVYLLVF